MRAGTIAFLLGILFLTQLPSLPGNNLTIATGFLTLLFLSGRGYIRIAGFFLAGFLWALVNANLILSHHLDKTIEGQTLLATGRVISLPEKNKTRIRFEFEIEKLVDTNGRFWPTPGKTRLSWYHDYQELKPGQRWQLKVRLKRPHGFMNPGGFDFERWLFQHHIRATGYIKNDPANRLYAGAQGQYLNRIRYYLRERIDKYLNNDSHSAFVLALALGDRSRISQDQREILNRSGTSHLLAISGLHIGLVAGIVFFLAFRIWSFADMTLYIPAPKFAAVAGILAALLYAMLAGFSIPTQRSLIMITILMASFFIYRRYTTSQVICFALMLVLIIDPFSVLDPGMWLSFVAISIIAFGMSSRTGDKNIWWRWGRVQYLVAIGLVPLLLFWFRQVPVTGFLVNLVAVPCVSLILVPLVLTGMVVMNFSGYAGLLLFKCADLVLTLLLPVLEFMGQQDFAVWHQGSPTVWVLLAGMTGVLILLQPRGLPARWLGIVWFIPVFIPVKHRPAENEFWFTLLDVGQGLSAVVITRNHALVYDTGAKYSDTFNSGDRVVIPYLRQLSVKNIDTLVISHADNDHIGGAEKVLNAYPGTRVLTSVPEKINHLFVEKCMEGQSWNWDGVNFKIIHPESTSNDVYENNQSCVIKVSAGMHRVLLTGDIEWQTEYHLVEKYEKELAASVLLAPHHGSKTSSTTRFIDQVNPDLVLFATGYRNRFRFPNEAIITRYESRSIRMYDTARNGAISIKTQPAGLSISSYRQEYRRFWHTDL